MQKNINSEQTIVWSSGKFVLYETSLLPDITFWVRLNHSKNLTVHTFFKLVFVIYFFGLFTSQMYCKWCYDASIRVLNEILKMCNNIIIYMLLIHVIKQNEITGFFIYAFYATLKYQVLLVQSLQ